MSAMFKHKKTGGLYTVIARVVASLAPKVKLTDMQTVGIRKPDLGGLIAVQLPNLGLECEATMQGEAENGDMCVLYRGTDGKMWLRPEKEFTDGRFEPMNNHAAAMMPPSWHLGLNPQPQAA